VIFIDYLKLHSPAHCCDLCSDLIIDIGFFGSAIKAVCVDNRER
jgi:hypothetical protein